MPTPANEPNPRSDRLAGRTVVVTGAARGVGRAIAQECARQGGRLVLCDVLEELGRETAAAIGQEQRRMPGVVNNAAIATRVGGAAFEDIELGLWDRVMTVNVRGTWLMTRAMSPLFAADGRIVNIASDTALWGPPRLLAYVTSKGAVISMTRSLARELGPRGIGVTAVAPGIMRNEATEYVPAARHQEYERGRAVPGPQIPEDIVAIVAFLLTPAALPLTGQVLPVNAGFVFT